MKTRDAWHKSAMKTNDQLHWNAYKFFRNEVKRELRLAEKVHVRTEIHNSRGNSNFIWKIINRCLPNKSQNGFNTCNPEILASRFNEFFTSVGSTTARKAHDLSVAYNLNFDSSIVGRQELSNDFCPAFQFRHVSQQDVRQVIEHFPSNKAPGYDKISARVLKDAILPALTHIMNSSFSSNTFAKVWKIAEVTPILKSGDIEDPSICRPISLLPILSKVSERLAHGQLTKFLTENEKLSKTQSGNRKLHSTETALLHVTDELIVAMDEKRISAVVLLDMSKAFDSRHHDLLLQKLETLGVSLSMQWFKSYLTNRYQYVRFQDAVSDLLPLKFGVPQGSILGPLLFTVYVNDLLCVPTHCKSVCYVDDCKLYLSFPSQDLEVAVSNLNEDLDNICRWCCQNSLLINSDKTKVLMGGVPQLLRQLPPFTISMLGREIVPVHVAKDLGVYTDQYLNYNEHINKTVSSCFHKLRQISRIKHLLDTKTLILLIQSFVFSKMFYCSTVWSNTSKGNVQEMYCSKCRTLELVLCLD